MSDPRLPAGFRVKTEVLFAASAPRAVILRRGPRRNYQLLTWNLRTDAIVPGQWMTGLVRLFDLSPDGSKLLYWAAQHGRGARGIVRTSGPYDPGESRSRRGRSPKRPKRRVPRYLRGPVAPDGRPPRRLEETWTAISTPPYFSALALWPAFGHWTGGGAFRPGGAICLFESPDGMTPILHAPMPATVRIDRVTEADWSLGGDLYAARRPLSPTDPRLRVIASHLVAAGARFVDWIWVDGDATLNFGVDGTIRRLADWRAVPGDAYLSRAHVVADLVANRFEPVPPPAWAMVW